jgi:hypothetical protein
LTLRIPVLFCTFTAASNGLVNYIYLEAGVIDTTVTQVLLLGGTDLLRVFRCLPIIEAFKKHQVWKQNKLLSCGLYSYVRKVTIILKVQLLILFVIFFALFTVTQTGMNTLNSHNFNKPQSAHCITAVYQKSAAQVTDTEFLRPFRSVI